MLHGTSKQIEALSIYYTYNPIQLENEVKDENKFKTIVEQSDVILSIHPYIPGTYRAIPISKSGIKGPAKYYSRHGKSCYSSSKAKRWFQQLAEWQEIWEHESQIMDYETFWKTYPGATLKLHKTHSDF